MSARSWPTSMGGRVRNRSIRCRAPRRRLGRGRSSATGSPSRLPNPIAIVIRSGQQVLLADEAKRFFEKVEFDPPEDGHVRRIRPAGPASPVVIDPLVRFGRPSVGGVSTERLWELFDAGETVDEIAAGYEISAEEVRAAVAYEEQLRSLRRNGRWRPGSSSTRTTWRWASCSPQPTVSRLSGPPGAARGAARGARRRVARRRGRIRAGRDHPGSTDPVARRREASMDRAPGARLRADRPQQTTADSRAILDRTGRRSRSWWRPGGRAVDAVRDREPVPISDPVPRAAWRRQSRHHG